MNGDVCRLPFTKLWEALFTQIWGSLYWVHHYLFESKNKAPTCLYPAEISKGTGPLRLTSAVHYTPHNSATQLHEKSMSHKMAIKYWQEDDVAQRRWLLRESTSDTSSHSPSSDQYKPSKSAALNTHNFAKKFLYPVPAGGVKKNNNLETTLRTHQDR